MKGGRYTYAEVKKMEDDCRELAEQMRPLLLDSIPADMQLMFYLFGSFHNVRIYGQGAEEGAERIASYKQPMRSARKEIAKHEKRKKLLADATTKAVGGVSVRVAKNKARRVVTDCVRAKL